MSTDILQALHSKNIFSWLRYQAENHPFVMAASLPSWTGHRDRLSYGQLIQRMESMASSLYKLGLRRGDRLALFLSNRAAREGVLTALGCWRLGAVVVPLNPRYAEQDLAYALTLTQPEIIVVRSANEVERICALGFDHLRFLVLEENSSAAIWPDPESQSVGESAPDFPKSPEDLSCLLFTSGTTARPKAVMHTHRSQLHAGAAVGAAMGLTNNDAYQGAFPLFTSSAFNIACMSAWVYGAAVVLEEDGLSSQERLRLIASECTTVYHGVPALLHFMVDEFAKGGYCMRHVRRLGYGGAPMPLEVMHKLSTYWPLADQVHIWGMTETGPAGTWLMPWMIGHKAGAVGVPQLGCSVRILAEPREAGSLQGALPGEVGEIAFAGPSAAQGYFRNIEASAETFIDGWVLTGDLGRFDDEGVLHYVDRKKDVINRGGFKISSAAVEDVLYRYPEISEAAVISIHHPKLGEDVAACVTARPGQEVDWHELVQLCQASLAPHEVPRHWFFVSGLPKNPMGKIQKNVLRQWVIDEDQRCRRITLPPSIHQ